MSAQENYPYYSAEQPFPKPPSPGYRPSPGAPRPWWGKAAPRGRLRDRQRPGRLPLRRFAAGDALRAPCCAAPHPNAVVKGIDARRGRRDARRAGRPDRVQPRGEPPLVLRKRGQGQALRIALPLRGGGDRGRGRGDGLPGGGRARGDQGRVRGAAAPGGRAQGAPGRRPAGPRGREPGQADGPLPAGRRGAGVRPGGRGPGADLPDGMRDPHAARTARLRGEMGAATGSPSGSPPRGSTGSSRSRPRPWACPSRRCASSAASWAAASGASSPWTRRPSSRRSWRRRRTGRSSSS